MKSFGFSRITDRLKNTRGQALLFILFVLILTVAMSDIYYRTTLHANRLLQRQRMETELFYFAEGATEVAILQFKLALANFQVDTDAERYPETGSIETQYSTAFSSPLMDATAQSVINEAEEDERTLNDDDGTPFIVKNYRVTTTVQHPMDPNFVLTLIRVIERRILYAFQHAVFYDEDLEILPGPSMTLSGRIHSNNDIYLGSELSLTIDSQYLRSTNDIFNRRKDNSTVPDGSVDIRAAGTSDFYDMDGLDSSSPNWAEEALSRWNGTVKSGVHGVTQLAVPSIGTMQPGGFYNNSAGIEIVNNTVKKNGVVLVPGVDIPPDTVVDTTSFFNNRENKTIKMSEVDLGKLGGGDFDGTTYDNQLIGSNGLIYASRDDVSASQQPGIRLVNGSEIKRSGGLTVVTEAPLYIQGDYNITDKKPTAVICDAVNILSNNWDDANSTGDLDSQRQATNTTINTAFVAGIDTTDSGNYNGGLENYPRMHEDWSPSGQPQSELKIRGSFVAIWNSQIAMGEWVYGDPQYEAPVRNWDYDASFQSGSLPPFTPRVIDIRRGAWWKG